MLLDEIRLRLSFEVKTQTTTQKIRLIEVNPRVCASDADGRKNK